MREQVWLLHQRICSVRGSAAAGMMERVLLAAADGWLTMTTDNIVEEMQQAASWSRQVCVQGRERWIGGGVIWRQAFGAGGSKR